MRAALGECLEGVGRVGVLERFSVGWVLWTGDVLWKCKSVLTGLTIVYIWYKGKECLLGMWK